MKCECGGETRVTDSRTQDKSLRRRRLCMDCGKRFSTLETIIPPRKERPKPIKVKEEKPFVQKEVADRIRHKKAHARRMLEEMRYAKSNTDIFDDEPDEDISWILKR